MAGLKVLQRSECPVWRLIDDVLEPRHVVHCCGTECETMGAGFDGFHGPVNEYLDNEYLVL